MMLSRALSRPLVSAAAFSAALFLALARSAFAAPPDAIAALVGEWSGETSHDETGAASAAKSTVTRRFWAEGDAVHGEIRSGSGSTGRVVRVAILPRSARFVKLVMPEGGQTSALVGYPAEGGVLWASPDSDKIRFVERVTGTGAERHLELLLPETSPFGENWKTAETLSPKRNSAGESGDSGVVPIIRPSEFLTPEEMIELDRIAELLEERDIARGNSNANARELATAWRELEEANARTKAAQAELKTAQAAVATAKAGTASPDAGARAAAAEARVAAAETRVTAAEKAAADARSFGEELEKSLRAANARADEAGARSQSLESDIASMRAAGSSASTQVASISAENTRLTGRVTELEQQIAAAGTVRSTLEQSLAGERTRSEALTAERDRLTGATSGLQQQIAQAGRERDEAQKRVAALEATVAELQKKTAEASASTVAASDLALAQSALRVAESARDEAKRSLVAARDEAEKLRQANATLEQQAATLRDSSARQTASIAVLEKRVSEIAAAPAAPVVVADDRRVALENELNTARAELALAETRQTETQRALADARATAETAGSQSRLLESDLGAARSRVSELEGAFGAARTRMAELERESSSLRAQTAAPPSPAEERIASLEQRLSDTYVRADAKQTEVDRLNVRLAEIESERASLASRVAAIPAAPASSSNETDRLQRRVEQLESARSDLEMRNTELATRLRDTEVRLAGSRSSAPAPVRAPVASAPVVASTPTVAPAPVTRVADSGSEPQIRFRLPTAPPGGAEPAPSATRLPPTRPADSAASGFSGSVAGGSDVLIAQTVRDLPLQGFRRSATGSSIVVGGRLVRAGEMADAARGVRFVRIDPDAIVFSGPDGREYRRRI